MRRYINGREVSELEFRGDEAAAKARFDEMVLSRTPPMSSTDREFLEGHCNGSQFEGQDYIADRYRREALAAGVDPKGKVYLGGLARYPGDPEAWVSGRGDVKRVVESRGWGCEGSVNVKSRPLGVERKPVPVAEDLVRERVLEHLASVPAGEKVDVEGVREKVVNEMKPHWEK
jgi:hypothetical protein